VSEVVLLHSAQADLLEIYSTYGEYWYLEVDKTLGKLKNDPGLGSPYHEEYRRKLVLNSPFGIFYTEVGDRVMVAFVLDLRQDLDAILRRLRAKS